MREEKDSILWFSWHRNPYNDFLFNNLSKKYLLSVYYISDILKSHPWNNGHDTEYSSLSLNSWGSVISLFRESLNRHSLRVIAGWNSPIMIFFIFYLILFNKKFCLWTDTPNIYKQRNFVKFHLRKTLLNFIFKHSSYVMVTGFVGVNNMKYFNIPKSKLINFPFATNLEYFVPLNDSNKDYDDGLVFLSSGRLVNSHKGFDISIRAFSIIKKKFPELKFKYLIAGTGIDEIKLKNLVNSENLQNEIIFRGWIQQSELLSFYQSGDIFIHPSYFDPYPNVVLEALSSGLPVLGTKSAGSVLDRVENGYNGYIFNEGNCNELAELIISLYDNKQNINLLKRNARQNAELWDVSFNISQIDKILY